MSLRRPYFETCLHSKEALELLIDPDTGRSMDDIKPLIDDIDWLTDADRKMIYEDNAEAVHNLKDLP